MNKAMTLPNVFTVTGTGAEKKYSVTDAFRLKAVKSATDLDALIVDIKPIALNMWAGYKAMVVNGPITGLQFYAMFDPSIPSKYPKVGSAERKALDKHAVFNRLRYITETIGKTEAGDKPKRDPKVAARKATAYVKAFGTWAKKYHVNSAALNSLVRDILGLKSKDGKLTKRGKAMLKEAGMSIE